MVTVCPTLGKWAPSPGLVVWMVPHPSGRSATWFSVVVVFCNIWIVWEPSARRECENNLSWEVAATAVTRVALRRSCNMIDELMRFYYFGWGLARDLLDRVVLLWIWKMMEKWKLHVGKEIGGWSEEEMVNDVNKCDKQWHRNWIIFYFKFSSFNHNLIWLYVWDAIFNWVRLVFRKWISNGCGHKNKTSLSCLDTAHFRMPNNLWSLNLNFLDLRRCARTFTINSRHVWANGMNEIWILI